ncbi:1-deoxy-D-xylulose-5-phosphate synthase [Motilibacter rhizosphaerae]|uniref:1-deoxy-D-xylulose-5-phosphate synthase n=1 Tax=Motilibacter rhizosphaerae TaxID=598652 RepID=A0A4Q7NR61_9ACTN|nr:1-deoxy-D-xylulose-5-phosphate synthase [Motilibacter rhizosphaerae]RZS89521.1 1-deoxy-D-xylulose-5-phosphate synthase [Motilibacter rhizosphaerae]
MGLLESISEPADLRRLDPSQLESLCAEIRRFLVSSVARTGGHLGPNLGVVELTVALHRVFESPEDVLLFDTGHQSYVHKLLTGRRAGFERLRQKGGLSGYPSRAESPHDVIENSHASTSLSYADGLAKAFQLQGRTDRHVVAVIGDGALTGGMAWEAMNNIATGDRPVVIVVNDNERSYAPTIGGMARHLATLRTTSGYERFLDWGKGVLHRTPVVGPPIFETLHGMKKGIKDIVAPQGLFEDLGLKYVGPVDGHDLPALEHALRQAKSYGGPVIVHAITRKGHGYEPAERDEADLFHAVGVIDPETGEPLAASGTSWTSVFADEMVAIGAARDDVVGITAAMCIPVGLDRFGKAFPDRVFDVGIAEQHAVTSAAGMATAGLHPVVAVYATFLNRAFDQVLLDVALHRCGVTFVLDRAGITGDDGASHNGMWDLAFLQVVPTLRIAAPRDAETLRAELREAVAVSDAPTVVRFPKGRVPAVIPAVGRAGGGDVLRREGEEDVLVVSVGAMAELALELADRLTAQGIGVTVVDPRWVKPVDPALVPLAARHDLVVTVEDGIRTGGVGGAVAQALRDAGVRTPLRDFGVPAAFLDHARPAEVKAEIGLTAQEISRQVVEAVARLAAPTEPSALS